MYNLMYSRVDAQCGKQIEEQTFDISNYKFCWFKSSKFKISKVYTIRWQRYGDQKILVSGKIKKFLILEFTKGEIKN